MGLLAYCRAIMGIVVISLMSMGCRPSASPKQNTEEDTANTPLIVVSIAPQSYFVERIAGPWVVAEVLVPSNHSPETHQITPRQMDMLTRASIYFRIGMPFEDSLLPRLNSTCPQLSIVDTRESVPLLIGSCHGHHEAAPPGDHAIEHDHAHGESDPHIWLDPGRVKIQVQTMAAALAGLLPQHAEKIGANLEVFHKDLDALSGRLTSLFEPVRGRVMYVYHPAFGYLADAYGFEQRAIEEEGKSPGSKRLYSLINEIKASGAQAIFDQPQFVSKEARTIATSAGIELVLLDNLSRDYLTNLEQMAETIAAYLRRSSPPVGPDAGR